MKELTFILLIGIVFACTDTKQKENQDSMIKKKEIPILDLASVIDKHIPDTFTLNSIAKSIKMIPISSNANALMGLSPSLLYIGNESYLLLSYQNQRFFKIDKEGKILNTFKYSGKGPGEYVYCSYIYVNPQDSTIQIFDNGNLKHIIYDYDGKFIKEKSLKESNLSYPLLIKDNYKVVQGAPNSQSQLYVTDLDLNVRKGIAPFDTSLTTAEKCAIYLQTSRTVNKDMMFFNHAFNDTVFTETNELLVPHFILRKGMYALPAEDSKKFYDLLDKGDPHILSLSLSYISGYYLVSYTRNNRFIQEVWSDTSNQIVSRFKNGENELGYPFIFPSGKKIRLSINSIFNKGKEIAIFIPAEIAKDEIPGVNEDDNPVLLLLELF